MAVLLEPPAWCPPGVPVGEWRRALAEDVVDLLAVLADVDVAIAAAGDGRPVAEAVRWPGMPVYEVPNPRPVAALAALAADGYEQGLALAADLPDLPALLVGKLFRPLSTRTVAAAPVLPAGRGLIGLAARLPVPEWLAAADPTLDAGLPELRTAAGSGPAVASGPGWHRLRGPADLALLDEALEGWDATRALLRGTA